MASIQKKKDTNYLVYDSYDNPENKRLQIWDPIPDDKDPKIALREFELKQRKGKLITRSNRTFEDLFSEFYLLHAQNTKQQNGTYDSNCGLIINHITPHIGNKVVQKFDNREYALYLNLLGRKVKNSYKDGVEINKPSILQKRDIEQCLSKETIRKIIILMNLAFKHAKAWKCIEEIPEITSKLKKDSSETPETQIWEAGMAHDALNIMESEDLLLCLAVHIAFMGTLRGGEAIGITLDIINLDRGDFYIGQTIQRVSKKSLDDLPNDSIIRIFPAKARDKDTILVLKEPKTKSSKRKIGMPPPLQEAIIKRINEIEEQKTKLGPLYNDFNLLFALPDGNPMEPNLINRKFKKWQKNHPEFQWITFKGLRHSGTTYKLMISNGDIKAVQADTGHSTARMVTDTYAHITDSPRKAMVNKINNDFYSAKSRPESANELFAVLKQDPAMLKTLFLAAMS